MKLLKSFLVTCIAIAALVLIPNSQAATAQAADTYTVKYVPALSEWRVQKLAQWDDMRENGALSYLYYSIKDGDAVVVIGESGAPALSDLKIDVKLANLTLFGVTGGVVVYANQSIKDIYVLKGSAASLHGSYENVYVYDNSAANVNNDVAYLQVSKETSMEMNVTALGTVGHCQIDDRGTVREHMYNVKAGALSIVKGVNKTDPSAYSTTPTGSPAPAPAPATTTPAGNSSTGNGATVSPKTGDANYAIWLFLGIACCVAAAFSMKKRLAR